VESAHFNLTLPRPTAEKRSQRPSILAAQAHNDVDMCDLIARRRNRHSAHQRVVRDDVHEMYFEDRHLDTVDFIRDAYKDDLALEGGLMVKECAALYVAPGADIPKSQQFNR